MSDREQNPERRIALFQWKEIRRTIHNNEWWFVITDVVAALIDSVDRQVTSGTCVVAIRSFPKRGANCGRVAQITFRFGCGADIPVYRFWGLSSPQIPRQTVSFGPRSWKTSQPAGSKACPTIWATRPCHPLLIPTAGGPQKLNCANTEGLFRIIQSIPSPKAEPSKRWLARVGYERIQEIDKGGYARAMRTESDREQAI